MENEVIPNRNNAQILLSKLFRSEQSDLDFGIYRIMNFKRKEIERFIDHDLIKFVESEFKEFSKTSTADLERELEDERKKIESILGSGIFNSLGDPVKYHDVKTVQEYEEKRKQLRFATITEEQVNEVYSHIYEFFSRYYEDGDFIPKTRYGGRDKYFVPYNGEEVMYHWATKEMYYVKTGEFFKKYRFKAGRFVITFSLIEAEAENRNVNSEKKYFILAEKEPVYLDEKNNSMEIKFRYRGLTEEEKGKYGTRSIQSALVIDFLEVIRSSIESSSIIGILRPKVGENRSLMEKHLNIYVSRNTMDFFVHKDLKGFLKRELDFYLKNEVWRLDELDVINQDNAKFISAKAKTIRNISLNIIDFLNQIESFQKKLFEKRKLILRTDYCITLDIIPEEFYEEIGKNEIQVSEWKKLYKLDETTKGTFFATSDKNIFSVDFLKQFKNLPIDTKYFSIGFKDELLSRYDDLDENINGLLIKSENYQAINIINKKYSENINFIYLDPPYNTGWDGFLYKDNYNHSSWLSMMRDRIEYSRGLLSSKGVIFISIDQNELFNYKNILDNIYGNENFICMYTRISKKGSSMGKYYSPSCDYILCYAKNINILPNFTLPQTEEYISRFDSSDEVGNYKTKSLYQSSLDPLRGCNNQRYFIQCPDGSLAIPPGDNFPLERMDGCKIAPKTRNDKVWRWSVDTYLKEKGNIIFIESKRSPLLDQNGNPSKWNVLAKQYFKSEDESKVVASNIIEGCLNADASEELKNINIQYDYPKPTSLIKYICKMIRCSNDSIVLDFFAGSGTTAHAIIDLNREENNNRKYIIVEINDYFDTIIIPRLKKVIFSNEWVDGIPISKQGISQLVKYQYVEQYEDTLNNIEFINSDGIVQKALDRFDDYFFTYLLDYETRDSPTRLSTEKFKTPFNYRIKTLSAGEEREESIDLVETFNYLLGLHIKKIRTYRDGERLYRTVFGERDHEQIAVIWRNTPDLDLERDKRFIEDVILVGSTTNIIFVNGDSYVKNAKPIELEFRRLMGV